MRWSACMHGIRGLSGRLLSVASRLPFLPSRFIMSAPTPEQLAIEVRQLTFTYTQGAESSPIKPEQTLEDIDLLLARGARCLLIGANGCESSSQPRNWVGARADPFGGSGEIDVVADSGGEEVDKDKDGQDLGPGCVHEPAEGESLIESVRVEWNGLTPRVENSRSSTSERNGPIIPSSRVISGWRIFWIPWAGIGIRRGGICYWICWTWIWIGEFFGRGARAGEQSEDG